MTLFDRGIIKGNDNKDLFSSDVISKCFLHFVGQLFLFLSRIKAWEIHKQSIMPLSSINNECDDSFLLLFSELLKTLAAFFPTKGKLT
jgi:hypothetical protein